LHGFTTNIVKNHTIDTINLIKMAKEVSNREENYSLWYNNLVIKADLAENSAVR